jgi:phenylacetate-CoA ligase
MLISMADATLAGDGQRALWDPDVQARDPVDVAANAAASLREEWERLWELPLAFHRQRMEAAGLGRDEMPPLDEIPRFDKAALRADEAAHPPFGTHRVVGLEQARRVGSSTGTTGTPTIIFYGERDLEVSGEVNVRNMWRHGVRRGDRFTHSWPQGIYPTNVTASRSYLTLGVLEIAVGPPFSVDVAVEHLRLWELLRPTAFMMTGGQLLTYEAAAAASGIDLVERTAGGTLVLLEASCQFDGPRTRVERAYGVHLRNTGGASEVPGLATTDCVHHTGLHVAGDHVVVQACDPVTGREVPDGERGTLVVSVFGIDAHFLRYDLQDVVTVSRGRCPCGESGPRYTLLGRGADAVPVAGRTLLPLDVQLALEPVGSPEFQLVADPDARRLRMRVECDGDARGIVTAVVESLDVEVDAETVAVGSLPRSSFKPRRVAT